ncbi:MAG: winged helix-turn-helix domain-containing protein [Burkholderiales bacterium]|nr:winged helix-turn-helix domain-containing protein [Burkholderiales bacterium]
MTDTVICFQQCELDIAAREVRLNGRPSWIEPRPFDLLVHLIRHRERVVAKKELLASVWPHEFVSSGALARAVMKARRAIGDIGEPALIKTVSRVGYRFVAPVLSAAADLAPTVPAASSVIADQAAMVEAKKLTFAVLPFEDSTDDSRFDWIRLGLMSLVSEMLSQDTRLSAISTQSVMAVATKECGADAQSLASMVQRLTNVQLVVGGKVSVDKAGYRLEYRVFGRSHEFHGAVIGEHPAELAEPMVGALVHSLFGDSQHDAAPLTTPVCLPAIEAFARGLQACGEQKWSEAANRFKRVLGLAPANAAAEFELLRSLANKGDQEGKRFARRLLVRAEIECDLSLAARVHQAMGHLHLHRGELAAAAFRAEKALRLAAGQESLDWTAQTLLLQASISVRQREFDAASRSIERVHELCERGGNRFFPLCALNMQAVIAGLGGDLTQAVQLLTEVVSRSRELQAQHYLADACANAAKGFALLGQLGRATDHGEESLALAMADGDEATAARAASILCLIYRLARAPQDCRRTVTALEGLNMPESSKDAVWQARGHDAACAGDHVRAAECFSNAIALQRVSNDRMREHDTWPWLITALVQCGRIGEADTELRLASGDDHADHPELSVHLRHCHALIAHATGDAEQALQILEQIVDMEAAPMWRAFACIDVTWLLAEAGRGDEAAALLISSEVTSNPHPLTLAATARALHAGGNFADANRAHAEHMSMMPASMGSGGYFASLGPIYAGQRAGMALPPIPFLPSRI